MASWLERMIQEFERASQQGSPQDQPGGEDGQRPEPGWSEPSEQAPGASEMDPDRVARLDREPSPWELMADPVANQALWLEAKHSLESQRTGYLSTELNDNARGWLGESDGGEGSAAPSIPVGLLRESGAQNEPPARPPLVLPAQPLGPTRCPSGRVG